MAAAAFNGNSMSETNPDIQEGNFCETTESNEAVGNSHSLSRLVQWNPELDEEILNQAAVYVEDAVYYRSVYHRSSYSALRLYRIYYSKPWQWTVAVAIAVIHLLAFFEYPNSSLSATADLTQPTSRQLPVPCWVTSLLEMLCLLVFFLDALAKSSLVQTEQEILRQPWLIAYFVIVGVSAASSASFAALGCSGLFHLHRILRPFFLIQHSSLMKKTMKCLHRTVPQVVTVLILVAVYLFIFTLIALSIVKPIDYEEGKYGPYGNRTPETNLTTGSPDDSFQFSSFPSAMFSMLVLLTTANNPDVTIKAYNFNRLYSLFFIVYLSIGLFCFMNMLTAVFYNEFRGYLSDSMQSRLFRRRLGVLAAYQTLHQNFLRFTAADNTAPDNLCREPDRPTVPLTHVLAMIDRISVPKWKRNYLKERFAGYQCMLSFEDFKSGFSILDQPRYRTAPEVRSVSWRISKLIQRAVLHKGFSWFSIAVCTANSIYIAVSLHYSYLPSVSRRDRNRTEHNLILINYSFVAFYALEHALLLWATGLRRYLHSWENIFYGCCTLALVVIAFIYLMSQSGNSYKPESITLQILMRFVNILIVLRVLRFVPQIKSIKLVWHSLIDIFRNLRFFVGILAVAYYGFAIIGMQLFAGSITKQLLSNETECDSFGKLGYYSINFNDFAASIVVLWDLMIVNNWHVIADALTAATAPTAKIYFVIWWLVSAIIIMNTFTALILDIYFLRLNAKATDDNDFHNRTMAIDDFVQVFRNHLTEPSFDELMEAIRSLHWHASGTLRPKAYASIA